MQGNKMINRRLIGNKKVPKKTYKDLYDDLWRGRDVEINQLWQRSIMLTAIEIVCFTAFGFLINNYVSMNTSSESELMPLSVLCDTSLNPLEISTFMWGGAFILICLLGMVFAELWILMAKGSKHWVERYEKGITDAQEKFWSQTFEPGVSKEYPRHGNLRLTNGEVNNSIFNLGAGEFSVSKINVFVGIILFVFWGFLYLVVGSSLICLTKISVVHKVVIAVFLFLFIPLIFISICRRSKSGDARFQKGWMKDIDVVLKKYWDGAKFTEEYKKLVGTEKEFGLNYVIKDWLAQNKSNINYKLGQRDGSDHMRKRLLERIDNGKSLKVKWTWWFLALNKHNKDFIWDFHELITGIDWDIQKAFESLKNNSALPEKIKMRSHKPYDKIHFYIFESSERKVLTKEFKYEICFMEIK